jgi:hypothetical protein
MKIIVVVELDQTKGVQVEEIIPGSFMLMKLRSGIELVTNKFTY